MSNVIFVANRICSHVIPINRWTLDFYFERVCRSWSRNGRTKKKWLWMFILQESSHIISINPDFYGFDFMDDTHKQFQRKLFTWILKLYAFCTESFMSRTESLDVHCANIEYIEVRFLVARIHTRWAHFCQLAHVRYPCISLQNWRKIFIFVSPDLFFRLKWIVMLSDNVR